MDMEQRLQEAYATGDADMIMKLLSGEAETNENPDRGLSDKDISKPFQPGNQSRLNPAAVEFAPEAVCGSVQKGAASEGAASESDEDAAVVSLCAIFPRAERSTVSALLWAHGGDAEAAQGSLRELDDVGALGPAFVDGADTSASFAMDAEGYAAAVAQFDADFPSLGGPAGGSVMVPRKHGAAGVYGDGRLLGKVRERGLAERVPWVDAEAVARVYQECGGNAEAAEKRVHALHPKPEGWDAIQAERTREAIRDACARASASMSVDDYDGGNEHAGGGKSLEKTKWVRTGSAVSRLYSEKRSEASDEARQRNKYFERAAASARSGNGAEAGRLGALGRASNARLHRLHEEASDLLWKEQNFDFVREGLIDLHGLHVKEALDRLPEALEKAAAGGRSSISVVFGTGHHSVGGHGAPRLRPAVLQFLDNEGYQYRELQDAKTSHVGAVSVDCRFGASQ